MYQFNYRLHNSLHHLITLKLTKHVHPFVHNNFPTSTDKCHKKQSKPRAESFAISTMFFTLPSHQTSFPSVFFIVRR